MIETTQNPEKLREKIHFLADVLETGCVEYVKSPTPGVANIGLPEHSATGTLMDGQPVAVRAYIPDGATPCDFASLVS